MRIMLLSDVFPPKDYGGMATHAHYMAHYLAKRHQTMVVLPMSNSKGRAEGPVRLLQSLTMRWPRWDAWRVLRIARAFRPDVVHVCNAGMVFRSVSSSFPTVARVVGNDFLRPWCGYNLPLRSLLFRIPGKELHAKLQYWELRLRKHRVVDCLKRTHQVVANSSWTRDRLLEEGVRPERVAMVVGGVDTSLFRPPVNREAVRKELGLDSEAVVLLTTSGLSMKKGIDTVLRVVASMVGRWPSLRYVVAGREEGLERLQRLAADLGIQKRVVFVGHLSHTELCPLYQAADVYVLVSQNETMGRTYFEAGACGIPVVAAGVEGVTAVVRDNVNGLLVSDPLDETGIRNRIESLLTDPAFKSRLGAEGLRMAREEFSWEIVGAAFERLLLAAAQSGKTERANRTQK